MTRPHSTTVDREIIVLAFVNDDFPFSYNQRDAGSR